MNLDLQASANKYNIECLDKKIIKTYQDIYAQKAQSKYREKMSLYEKIKRGVGTSPCTLTMMT